MSTTVAPKVTPAGEHYLAAIYALTAERKDLIGARLAEHLRVSAPSITQTLQRLVRDGFVTLEDHGDRKMIRLTAAGMAIGAAATRKHRLIERWLEGELKLTPTAAHAAALNLESGFTPELLDRLFEALGHPTTCPHGNPIPGSGAVFDHSGLYLDAVSAGDRVTVGRITEEAEADLDLLDYLERHTVRPGSPLTIIAVDDRSGAVTAMSPKGTEIRLERGAAALIYVNPQASETLGL